MHFAKAAEPSKAEPRVEGEARAVVDDLLVPYVVGVDVREAGGEESVGFCAKDLIDGGVDGWGVEGAKGHDDATTFVKVGAVEGGLFLTGPVDGDLVMT